jgi:hypothetical protein
MDDVLEGERSIKDAGEKYLPMTEGQRAAGDLGRKRYDAYKNRANFPCYAADTATAMLGVMHESEPDSLKLPKAMEAMIEKATPDAKGLAELQKAVNAEQLKYGRCGLLLDAPTGKGLGLVPTISLYPATKILSWNVVRRSEDGRDIIDYLLLDESALVFDKASKGYETDYRYRVCALDEKGQYYTVSLSQKELAEFSLEAPELEEGDYPKLRGKKLKEIPFRFVNVENCDAEIAPPPLLPLANICLTIYRGDADYRGALYNQAQAILFASGFTLDSDSKGGLAGGVISTDKQGATLSFVEPQGAGLGAMRESQNDGHQRAQSIGVALIDQGSSQQSGAALTTRLSVKTGSMKNIATTAAKALKQLLQLAAEWMGAKKDEVEVSPYLDFQSAYATAQEVLNLWQAVQQGAMSPQSYHEWLVSNKYTSKTYDEEQTDIELAKAQGGLPQAPEPTPQGNGEQPQGKGKQ